MSSWRNSSLDLNPNTQQQAGSGATLPSYVGVNDSYEGYIIRDAPEPDMSSSDTNSVVSSKRCCDAQRVCPTNLSVLRRWFL